MWLHFTIDHKCCDKHNREEEEEEEDEDEDRFHSRLFELFL